MKPITLLLLAVLFTSCATSKSGYLSSNNSQNRFVDRSLFTSSESTITEDDIQKILDGKINLPDSATVAVFNFDSRYFSDYGYNEQLLKLKQDYVEDIKSTVASADRVQKISIMSPLIIDNNPSLTNLRESAVRLQADLLLIFSIKSNIFYRHRAYKHKKAKAFATIDLILLDVRTGVVPHSDVVTEEQIIVKKETDLNLHETLRNAEREAILKALNKSGQRLVAFLDSTEY